jgi:hypothetical protein
MSLVARRDREAAPEENLFYKEGTICNGGRNNQKLSFLRNNDSSKRL